MRLHDGTVFPIPLAVPVFGGALRHPGEVALTDEGATVLALLEIDDVYRHDSMREMRAVLGAADTAHPLVREAERWPTHYIAGRPRVLDLPRHRLHGPLCLTPAQTRERLAAMGHDNVVAFQTRNPMHRIHEELTKRAARAIGGSLLIHPAVGVTQARGRAPRPARRGLRGPGQELLRPGRHLLSLMPLAMRMAGPREAVWHSIIRRNYGASHLIIGRDHAGPGKDSHGNPFYGPYDAQVLAEKYADEIGVQPIEFEELVYLADEDRYEEAGKVPPALASSPSPAPRCARSTSPRA